MAVRRLGVASSHGSSLGELLDATLDLGGQRADHSVVRRGVRAQHPRRDCDLIPDRVELRSGRDRAVRRSGGLSSRRCSRR
eukprot:2310040-Rhodomonas_salina.2